MDPDEEMEEYCHGDRLPHWADGDRCMNYGDPGAPAERPRPPDGEGPAAPAGGAGDGFDGWDDYNFPRENGDAGAEAAPRPPASEAPGGTPPPPPSRGGGGEHPPSSTEATPANSRDTQSATFRRAAGAGEAGRSLGLGFLAGTPPGDVPSEMRGGGAGASRGTNGGGAEVKTGEAVSPDEATAPKAPAGTVADPSSSSSSPSKLQASADKGEITADRLNGSEGGRRRGARASRPTRTSSFDYTPHVRKYSRRKGTAGSEDGKGAAADAVPSSAEGKAALATAGKGDGDAIATKKRKRGPGRPRKDGKEKRGRGRPRKDAAAKYPLGKVPERREPPPKTPAELYGRIQKSRDRLFFVAYRQDDDDDDKQRSPSGGGGSGRRPSSAGGRRRTEQRKHWYLVRVDVGTAERQLDMRPEESGEYYVEVRFLSRARKKRYSRRGRFGKRLLPGPGRVETRCRPKSQNIPQHTFSSFSLPLHLPLRNTVLRQGVVRLRRPTRRPSPRGGRVELPRDEGPAGHPEQVLARLPRVPLRGRREFLSLFDCLRCLSCFLARFALTSASGPTRMIGKRTDHDTHDRKRIFRT